MSANTDMRSLLSKTVAAFAVVDRHVLRSHYVRKQVLQFPDERDPVGFDYSDPEAYLENEDPLDLWDRYFQHILGEWERDVYGDIMSEAQYNAIVERLSLPSTALDQYAPLLVKEYRGLPNTPEKRIQGILTRRSALNTFLNSADIGLYHWWKQAGILEERTVRRRRPIPHFNGEESQSTASGTDKRDAEPDMKKTTPPSYEPTVSINDRMRRTIFMSNATLIALTSLVTFISCALAFRSFDLSIAHSGLGQGKISDPGFYSTLQNSAMQLLNLYVTVLPALRYRRTLPTYWLWTWLLAFSSFACTVAAAVCYVPATALASLLGFGGSALQAFVMLQLIWMLDDAERARVRMEKDV